MELDKHGLGRDVRTLCSLEIVNDGTGTGTHGNYRWKLMGRDGRTIKHGRLDNWPRQAKSPGQMLHAVLEQAYE